MQVAVRGDAVAASHLRSSAAGLLRERDGFANSVVSDLRRHDPRTAREALAVEAQAAEALEVEARGHTIFDR